MRKPKSKSKPDRRKRMSHSASKPTTPLNRVRGAVGEKKKWTVIRDALDYIKNDSSYRDIRKQFLYFTTNPLTAVAFPASKTITKLNRIQSVPALTSSGLVREIYWVATVLAAQYKVINDFVFFRDEYISHVCLGKYEEAVECLARIDEKCGFSLWTIENRISIAALTGGFEGQRKYVNELITKDRRSFVAFFGSYVGERNESRVSKSLFESRLRDKAKSWDIKNDFKTYVFYKLLSTEHLTEIDAADILSFEASSSTVDLYETFINIIIDLQDTGRFVSNGISRALDVLTEINDHCLQNIRAVEQNPDYSNYPNRPYWIAFLEGKYEESRELVANALLDHADDPLAIIVSARLLAMGYQIDLENNPFISLILAQLKIYLEQEKGNDEASLMLERFATNFRSIPISSYISLLTQKVSVEILGELPAALAIRTRDSRDIYQVSIEDEIDRQESVDPKRNLNTIDQYLTLASKGEEIGGNTLSAEARAYALLSFCRRSSNYSDSYQHLNTLSESKYKLFQLEACVLKAWFLYEDGNVFDAVRHTVNTAVYKPALIRSLPIREIFEYRGFRDLKQLEGELCLSIGLFLYINLTRESSKDVALKVAWKQFHKAHSLVKPSELKTRFTEFDSGELLFFLRNVCSQEIMELSSAFNSPSDLDKERLQICIALAELDTESSSSYDNEIIELTRRLSIEDGVQQVESSRVYVDILGIQRWCHQNLNDLFLRYLDYKGSSLHATAKDIERSLLSIYKRSSVNFEVVHFLDGYDISEDSLLGELIEECADHFMTLPRFGLDAFLGSRVRHGSLEGAFRSPLEARALITKIDSTTNQYERNIYWLNLIESENKEQIEALNKALNNFSAKIDGLLDAAISQNIHVQTTDKPQGLITLWPTRAIERRLLLKKWIVLTKASLSQNASIDQFVEYCANDFFWPALKSSLAHASKFVTGNLASDIQTHLDELAESVRRISPNRTGLIARINAAKNDIETAASKVSKWFSPPQFTNLGATYLLKTGIEIGINSLRHIRPQFNTNIDWDVDEKANVLLHPAAFQNINDVAFLIFGNIQKHSGFFDGQALNENRPLIKIFLRWIEPDIIEVEVLNSISVTKNLASIRDNVSSAKEQIRLGHFDSVARQKNKTGLVRLASTINYEGSEDKKVDFEVMDDNLFRVTFSVPVYFLTGHKK